MIDVHASQGNYIHHLEPVWRALPNDVKGTFHVATRLLAKQAEASGLEATLGGCRFPGPMTLVAGYHDLHECHPDRPLVYLTHGVDQTYADHPRHPSYAGGKQRGRVNLFLVPNEASARKERATYPEARVEVIGCPRLDPLFGTDRIPATARPTVAFAWHWDCPIVPESRWAFPQWREHMVAMHKAGEFKVIGTGHPRLWGQFQAFYDRHGIEAFPDPNDVLERADVVVFDNTSLGYEAMAVGRGVVALNATWYRPDVNHGLRFWDLAPILTIWPKDAGLLPQAVRDSLLPMQLQANQAMTRSLYPPATRGNATRLAVDAILSLLSEEP